MPRIDTDAYDPPPTRELRKLLRAAFTADDLYQFCETHPLFQPCLGNFATRRLEEMIQVVLAFAERRLYWEELLDGIAEHAPHEYNHTATQMGWPLMPTDNRPQACQG